MTLEQLMALLATKATRLKALVSQDTLTDDEKTEKRTLFTECTDLKKEVKEAEEERDLLADLDTSFVAPPAGGQPGNQTIAVVGEPPVYRTLGAQLQDVICVGKNAPGAVKARERLAKAETRMEAEKTLDVGLKNHLDKEEQRAAGSGQVVGVTADGGGFVQTDFATDMIHTGFNNSAILPKTQKRVMSGNSNSIEIFGIDEKSRANGSRNGGVVVYTKAELEQYDASKAKFKGFEMKVNKLTGLLYLSDEIMEDASFLEGEVSGLFGAEFEFKTQYLLMSGTGVGEPLGIDNADCLISITKESEQVADTVVAENIDKMIARIAGGGAEFYGNRDIYPQLSSMYRKVDSNNVVAMYKPTGLNSGLLNGVPTTFIEQAPTLGDAGDIGLYDWTQYVTATKGGFKKAESMHFKFDYGQKAIKFTLRFEGQPRWRSAITPFKGAATTSPFIRIAARA
jgi:HK97 family phage major capsid protein